ncbi:MAG: DUF1707 domain-containing protein [Candidatus Dormibacteria bacterium]
MAPEPPLGSQQPGPSLSGFTFGRQRGASIRASDEDRDRASGQLAEHHAAGRLTTDELRERTDRVYDARTIGELRAVLSDLPDAVPVAQNPWEAALADRKRGPFPGYAYAGFWARAGGLWVDLLVIGGIFVGLDPVLTASHLHELGLLVAPVYFTGFWGAVASTPGMLLVGVQVVRGEDGGRLGFRRSFLRGAGYLLDLASCFVGFGWAAIDPHRQGWHDKIAGSYVVRRRH